MASLKDLTILIPTYNRKEKLLSLLQKLSKINCPVQIIIGDNSDERIANDLFLLFHNLNVNYTHHEENIGMLENFRFLYRSAETNYCLMIGDDDEYDFSEIFDKFERASDFDCLYFLHTVIRNNNEIRIKSFISELLPDSWLHLKLKPRYIMQLMFIGAAIHRKDYIFKLVEKESSVAMPLRLMLYVLSRSDSRLLICDVAGIKNVWGDESWSEDRKRIFSSDIIDIFKTLIKEKYSFRLIYLFVIYRVLYRV